MLDDHSMICRSSGVERLPTYAVEHFEVVADVDDRRIGLKLTDHDGLAIVVPIQFDHALSVADDIRSAIYHLEPERFDYLHP